MEVPALSPALVVDDCSPERLPVTAWPSTGDGWRPWLPEGDVFDMLAGLYSPQGMANFGV